jgi:hypothetical protein
VDQCQSLSDRQSLFWGESGDKVDHFAYAKRFRGLAEEFRRMAQKITEEHTRNSFLELAVCYDALANNEELTGLPKSDQRVEAEAEHRRADFIT